MYLLEQLSVCCKAVGQHGCDYADSQWSCLTQIDEAILYLTVYLHYRL